MLLHDIIDKSIKNLWVIIPTRKMERENRARALRDEK
jgi:hypothetical protein